MPQVSSTWSWRFPPSIFPQFQLFLWNYAIIPCTQQLIIVSMCLHRSLNPQLQGSGRDRGSYNNIQCTQLLILLSKPHAHNLGQQHNYSLLLIICNFRIQIFYKSSQSACVYKQLVECHLDNTFATAKTAPAL